MQDEAGKRARSAPELSGGPIDTSKGGGNSMSTKSLYLAATAIALLAATSAAAENPVVYDDWNSGNAGAECAYIGNYAYSYKFNEGDGEGSEGAPNETETAEFYDLDGNLVHSNSITISNSNGNVFDWSSNPNGIGAVIVKAGTGANVWFYDPQERSDVGLYAYENRQISHVTFCWNLDYTSPEAEWCSPGYWRQVHHLDSWEATEYSPEDNFYLAIGYYPDRTRQGVRDSAPTDPTLWQVLQAPQWYGGDAFNAVGDLLSTAHPDVNFEGERAEDSCPLN
jgi:hypothetical protein